MPLFKGKETSEESKPNHRPIVGGAQGGVSGQLMEEANQKENRGKIVSPLTSGLAAEAQSHPQQEPGTTLNS